MNGTTIKYIGLGVLLWSLVRQKSANIDLKGLTLGLLKAASPHAIDALFPKGTDLGATDALSKIDWRKLALSGALLWFIWGRRQAEPLSLASAPDNPKATKVGVSSLEDRIRILNDLIQKGKENPDIRKLASQILSDSGVQGKDWSGEVQSIFDFVRTKIRYTRDVVDLDTFQAANRTLELGIGDCDDMSTLIASLLGAIGYPSRLKVVSIGGKDWDHIYPLVGLPPYGPDRWIALDASIDEPIGSETPYQREKIFEVA